MNLSLESRGLVRSLRRDPAFLAASVLTLGLGIGAGAAVFSLVKAVLLAPLPWREPESLVMVWNRPPEGSARRGVSAIELAALREAEPIEGVAGFFPGGANLVLDGRARQLWVTRVAPGALETLGVRPLYGRDFGPDDHEGTSPVILSHELWSEAFGSDPAAVGRAIRFDGADREIVGVLPSGVAMPTDYRWTGRTEIWMPASRAMLSEQDPEARPFWVAARLRPGVTPETARAALETTHRRLQAATPQAYPGAGWGLEAEPVDEEVLASGRRTLTMLSIAVALVIAVAASNLALLLAARGQARQRELAIRAALGATAAALGANGILEAVAVAVLGAATGIGLAFAAVSAVPALAPGAFPRSDGVAVDLGVVVFALALSLAVALAVGSWEAWRRRNVNPRDGLIGGRGVAGDRGGARRALLALEIALSSVLVAGASLLLQSLENQRRAPLGFEPAGVVTGDIVLPEQRYASNDQIVAFFEQVRERARALPGVVEAGWTTTVPFWNPAGSADIDIEPAVPRGGPAPRVAMEAIGPGLLRALGTPLLRGRDVHETDREGTPLVALVNRAFERQFWPGDSAVGHRVRLRSGGQRPWLTIVGVVENVRDEAITEPPRARISIPFRQMPEAAGRPTHYLSLMVRARGDAAALVEPLRGAVAAADSEVPLGAARALSSEVRGALARSKLAARLAGVFAAAALALVLAGLYGLLASSVSRRLREIGVRLALGAPRSSVVRLIVRDGLVPVAAGLAVGVAGAAAAARLARSLLYGVEGNDPLSLCAAVVAILATAASSSAIPALRALRVDPASCLRRE